MIRNKRHFNKKKVSRKERMAKIFKKCIFGLSVLTAFIFFLIFYRTISGLEVFKVKEIEIKGNSHISKEELLNITNIKRNNILRVNLEDLRRRVLKSPWVKEVMVRRELPGTIRIKLSERVPEAIIDYGDSFYLVDEDRVIIEKAKDRGGYLLPLISGVDLGESRLGESSSSMGLSEGLALLKFLKDNGLSIDDIELVAKEPEDLTLNRAGKQIKVGAGDYNEKFRRLNEIEKELGKKKVFASSIDLRFPGKVIVIPMAGSSL